MADKQSKADALRAMREAKFAAKSSVSPGEVSALSRDCSGESEPSVTADYPPGENTSDGGVKESPASIPDYNGVKSPALVKAHGLSGKSCPLSRVTPGPSETNPKRGRPRIGEVRTKPWLTCDPPMSERTWRRRQKESKT